MSEAHEDCICSRGLRGMHACLGKARSESLLYFRISSGVFKQKTNSSSVRRIVFAAEVLEGCTLAWERREVNPFCILESLQVFSNKKQIQAVCVGLYLQPRS